MCRRSRVCVVLFAVLTVAPPTAALADFDPAERAGQIAPYIDEGTLLIARLDPGRVDYGAMVAELRRTFGAAGEEGRLGRFLADLEGARPAWDAWAEAFTGAGGEAAHLVVTTVDGMTPHDSSFFVFTHGPGADVEELAERIGAAGVGMHVESIGGAVVSSDNPALLDRLREEVGERRAEREGLVDAFAAAGDTAAQVLLVPGEDHRRAAAEMAPDLPAELGGGPATVVTRGVVWAAVGADGSREMSLRVTIRSEDARAAEALEAVVDRALDLLARRLRAEGLGVAALLGSLRPERDGDRLVVRLEADELAAPLRLAIPSLARGREEAQRAQTSANLRQIAVAIHVHAGAHDGELPDDLEALRPHLGEGWETVMTNPRTGEMPGYVYMKPAERLGDVEEPSRTMILYEAHDEWPGAVDVGFADGHVQLIEDREEFQSLLRRAEEIAYALSIRNMSRIARAFIAYAEDHDQALPNELEAVRPYIAEDESWDRLMTNPRTGQRPGYIYLKPADHYDEITDMAHTPIFHEAHDRWSRGVAVAFANGAVRLIEDREEFRALLAGEQPPGRIIFPRRDR